MARLSKWERRELAERKRREKERVGAVTHGELKQLQAAVKKLFNRVIASKSNGLTNDDFLMTFVKPEHHELMKLAPQLIEDCPRGGYVQHHIDGIGIGILFNPTYATPRYVGQYVAPGEGYDKLQDWLKWRIETGRKWALVDAVLKQLCTEHCPDLKTVRFFWPAILALCSHVNWSDYPRLNPDKMRDLKVPSDLPLLSPGLKAALAETCETVAVSLMLPADYLEQPVALDIASTGALPIVVTPWGDKIRSF